MTFMFSIEITFQNIFDDCEKNYLLDCSQKRSYCALTGHGSRSGRARPRGRKRAVTMKVVFWMSVAIFSLCLAFVVAPLCRAHAQAGVAQTSSPDMSQRVQELERQINELRSELAAIKQGGASATTASSTPTPTPPQNNLAPTSGSATATPAGPSLAGLLGPTTLSGFVDTYYGQNFNNPASRNNMLRAFDLSTNHFGMRAKYTFNDKYAVTGYLVNGWNDVVDNNTGKTYGATFAWNPNKKFGIAQNYMAGPEQTDINSNWRQLSDTVVTYSPTGRLSFMVNYDYARGDRIPTVLKPVYWTGAAGYVRYLLNATNALATRYEYYDDKYGVTTGGFLNPTPQHLHEFTETYEHLLAHHILTRFEFRRDMSNQPSFLKGTTPVMTQNTATAGFVFMFDSRQAK